MSATATTAVESSRTDPQTVDPQTIRSWSAPLVVNVRSAAEYEAMHIGGSHHVPLATLPEHTTELARHFDDPDHPLGLVCQSGVRAEQARQHLTAVGIGRARVLDGGVPAYTAASGDVVRGRRTWALERQVRLVAGALVLGGLTAGRYLSPQARQLAGRLRGQ